MASVQRWGGCKQVLAHFGVTLSGALWVGWLFAGALGLWVLAASVAHARESVAVESGVVALASLPVEAQRTYRSILAGGPFPHPRKDSSVFGNRERQLPRHPRGYYREYTVPTPGARNRGARRIVCGGNLPTTPEVCYYTQDHYASFSRIAS